MEQYQAILMETELFAGIPQTEIPAALDCLGAHVRQYHSGQPVLQRGHAAGPVGIVLSGAVHVARIDYWGNRTIVARIEPGGMFGEAYAYAGVAELPVSVMCARRAEILWIDAARILPAVDSACAHHTALTANMLGILARKNVLLNNKLDVLSHRRMRGKILAFLQNYAAEDPSHPFEVPFNREEMADYLGVDRSALSAELSHMQAEGLVEFHKNQFRLTLQ